MKNTAVLESCQEQAINDDSADYLRADTRSFIGDGSALSLEEGRVRLILAALNLYSIRYGAMTGDQIPYILQAPAREAGISEYELEGILKAVDRYSERHIGSFHPELIPAELTPMIFGRSAKI